MLTAGRSTVLATDFDITRIAVTNPAVADAVVVQPREVLIDGKTAGTVSLIIWGAGQARAVRCRGRTGREHAAAETAGALPRGGHHRDAERRGPDSVGPRVEHGGDAEGRRNRPGERRESESHQHAAGAGRAGQPAGDAAGAICRGESARDSGTGRESLHGSQRGERLRRADNDGAVHPARIRPGRDDVRRFPQSVRDEHEVQHRGGNQGTAAKGLLPESGGTEPDRVQRTEGEFPGRRGVPGSGGSGR